MGGQQLIDAEVDQRSSDDSEPQVSAPIERICAAQRAPRSKTMQPATVWCMASTSRKHSELRQVRRSSLFADSLQRRRRIDQALFAVIDGGLCERHERDVKVDNLVKALGARHLGISKSEHLSRSALELDEEVARVR